MPGRPTGRLASGLSPTAVAVLLGTLMGFSGMGSAAVAVAVPQVVEHHGVPEDRGVWVVAAYALMVAVGTALYGRLGDSRGLRGPLALGVTMLALGGVLAAVAPTYPLLVAARLVQGAGAAAAPTLTLFALRLLYPPHVRVAAIATLVGTSVAVTALGPVLGGLLTDLVGWQCTVLFPAAGLVGLAVLWPILPTTGTGERLDYGGALLVAVVTGGAMLLVQAPVLGWTALAAGGSMALLGLPVLWRHVAARPSGFLPHAVLRRPAVLWAAFGGTGVTSAYFGLLVVVPPALAEDGWQPLQIGLAMLPGALVGVAVSLRVARLIDRYGAGRCVGLASLGGLLAVLVSVGGVLGSPLLHVLSMAVAYSAFSLGQPAVGTVVNDAVPAELNGIALGMATLVFFGGGSVGAAVAGLGVPFGWAAGLLALALLPALAALAARRLPPRDAAEAAAPA